MRYAAPPFSPAGSVVCRTLRGYCINFKNERKTAGFITWVVPFAERWIIDMILNNKHEEPLSDLFRMCKYVEEDCSRAFYRELQLFWELESRGFFKIEGTEEFAQYFVMFRKMTKENEVQLQRINNILKVMNDNIKKEGSLQTLDELNKYFSR